MAIALAWLPGVRNKVWSVLPVGGGGQWALPRGYCTALATWTRAWAVGMEDCIYLVDHHIGTSSSHERSRSSTEQNPPSKLSHPHSPSPFCEQELNRTEPNFTLALAFTFLSTLLPVCSLCVPYASPFPVVPVSSTAHPSI